MVTGYTFPHSFGCSAATGGGFYDLTMKLLNDPRIDLRDLYDHLFFSAAVEGGNLQILKEYLKRLNINSFSEGLLPTAAQYNSFEIMQWWLTSKTPEECPLPKPEAASLVSAAKQGCKAGHFEVVRLLLELHPEILDQQKESQIRFFSRACASGSEELVSYLIKKVDPKVLASTEPLVCCIKRGFLALTKLLTPYVAPSEFLEAIVFAPTVEDRETLFSWYAWPVCMRYIWLGFADEESIFRLLPEEFKLEMTEKLIASHHQYLMPFGW